MYVTELAFGQVLGYQIPIQFSNFVGVVNSQAAVHAIAAGSCGEFFDEWVESLRAADRSWVATLQLQGHPNSTLLFFKVYGMTSAARSVIRALTSAGLSVAELLKLPVAAQVKEGNKLGVAAGVPLTADDVREDGLQLAMYTHFSPSAGGKACAARTVINALIVGNLFVADLLSLPVTEQIEEGEKRGVAAGVPLTADDDIREEWQILAKIEGFNTCLDCPKLGALTP